MNASVPISKMAKSPKTSVTEFSAHDFEELEEAWKTEGWDADYRQLAPGTFRGRLLSVHGEGVALTHGVWDGAIRHQGLQPKGTVSLAITLAQEGSGTFEAQSMTPESIIVQTAGTGFELMGPRRWESAVFLIPEADFVEGVAAVSQRDPREMLGRRDLARVDPEVAGSLRRRCFSVLESAERALVSPESESPPSAALEDLVADVVCAVASPLARLEAPPHPSRRRELVRDAEDYALATATKPVRMTELCRALGVSERTLRYAFQDVRGEGPASCLRTLRLNRAHRMLRDVEPCGLLVKQAAHSNGFTHLGDFARSYERLFGELPSETLARRAR
jgi:AraC family ethanolamine operon transcriptional activator